MKVWIIMLMLHNNNFTWQVATEGNTKKLVKLNTEQRCELVLAEILKEIDNVQVGYCLKVSK